MKPAPLMLNPIKDTSGTANSSGPQDPEGVQQPDPKDGNPPRPQQVISAYLMANSLEFRQLHALRHEGWKSSAGDAFFHRQRKQSDKSSKKNARFFYSMMKRIALQLQRETSALRIPDRRPDSGPNILDMCMAPGGFLFTALQHNPTASAVAFSLTVDKGGHECLLPEGLPVETHFVDITMLASDMGTTVIPPDHPEAGEFQPSLLTNKRSFDLVLCDGQVLRTYELPPYRQKTEARRLSAAQLVLSLQNLKPGGTLVFLMHKIEAWRSIQTIYAFSRFSDVFTSKPTTLHAKRSSFYLIAKNVQTESAVAAEAVEFWRETWRTATFPTKYPSLSEDSQEYVEWPEDPWRDEDIVHKFGPELLKLGTLIWRIQARALAEAPFINAREVHSEGSGPA